jgi:TolB-like protein
VLVLIGVVPDKFKLRREVTSGAPQIRSLAVLPLQNLSADPAQEYFSEGMTDALITDLAQIGSLKVISRTSSMQYKESKKSLPEIARELNVDGIVEGTVQRSGDRVRITAQLIHGPSDKHLWANSYEREMRDIFTLEREVTEDIARHVQAQVTTEHQVGVAQPRPVNLDALEAYLEGKFHLNKGLMGARDEELGIAGKYFQKAIDADPTFAPAYIGLSEAHHTLFWGSSEDSAIMKAFAEKALELAPTSSEAHEQMSTSKFENRDWAGAEEESRRAVALNPNSASAHHSLGDCLDTVGKLDEGWKQYEIAQELDPNQDHLSGALYTRGQYDRAIELLRKTVERRPADAVVHYGLSENYARNGAYKEWDQELGTSLTQAGVPEVASRIHRAFTSSGYRGALRQEAVEIERLYEKRQGYFPGILAEVYAILGDKDRAFYWLGQGCEHWHMASSDPILSWLKVDPGFASLRSDPRYQNMLRCMGLPP